MLQVLEEIEESKAFWEVYDGAVYMFQVRQRFHKWQCASDPASALLVCLRA